MQGIVQGTIGEVVVGSEPGVELADALSHALALRGNCISFCSALCIALGVGPVPAWVDRFPRLGAGGQEFAERVSAAASAASDALSQVMRPASKSTPPAPAEVDGHHEVAVVFQRSPGSYNNVWSPNKRNDGAADADGSRTNGGWVAGSVSDSQQPWQQRARPRGRSSQKWPGSDLAHSTV